MDKLSNIAAIIEFLVDPLNQDLLRFRLRQNPAGCARAVRAIARVEQLLNETTLRFVTGDLENELLIMIAIPAWAELFELPESTSRQTPRSFVSLQPYVQAVHFVKNAFVEANVECFTTKADRESNANRRETPEAKS